MTWRSTPPSQYVGVKKGGGHVPFWALVLVAVVCLCLGITAGLTLRSDDKTVDPVANGVMKKRQRMLADAEQQLASLTQLDAAVGVRGTPSSFGLVTLGKERRDVCVTGKKGLLFADHYASACGVQVTWYIAAAHGSKRTVEAAAYERFQAARVPTLAEFQWSSDTGPLPSKLSGQVRAVDASSTEAIDGLQRSSVLAFPEMDATYYEHSTSFDLPTAYEDHGGDRKLVARISLVAEYSWK